MVHARQALGEPAQALNPAAPTLQAAHHPTAAEFPAQWAAAGSIAETQGSRLVALAVAVELGQLVQALTGIAMAEQSRAIGKYALDALQGVWWNGYAMGLASVGAPFPKPAPPLSGTVVPAMEQLQSTTRDMGAALLRSRAVLGGRAAALRLAVGQWGKAHAIDGEACVAAWVPVVREWWAQLQPLMHQTPPPVELAAQMQRELEAVWAVPPADGRREGEHEWR